MLFEVLHHKVHDEFRIRIVEIRNLINALVVIEFSIYVMEDFAQPAFTWCENCFAIV